MMQLTAEWQRNSTPRFGIFFVIAGTARTVIGTAVLVKAHLIASVV
jgi:hypothetical protein